MKSAYTKKCEVNPRNLNCLKLRKETISMNQSPNCAMTTETKDFIQKICYKKTASIDMTQYGFVNDRKSQLVNLLMKPIKEQLEKICGKPATTAKSSVPKKSPVNVKVKLSSRQQALASQSHPRRDSPRTPKSAQCSPGTHTPQPQPRVRRVRIQSAKPYNRKQEGQRGVTESQELKGTTR